MGPRGPQGTNTHSTIMTGGHYDGSIPRLPGMPEPSGPPGGDIHDLKPDGTEFVRALNIYAADESDDGEYDDGEEPAELCFDEETDGPLFFGGFE